MMPLKKIKKWAERFFIPDETARKQFDLYRQLLREDRKCLRLITRLEEIAHRPILVDWSRIGLLVQSLSSSADRLVNSLEKMRPNAYPDLFPACKQIQDQIQQLMPFSPVNAKPPYALSFKEASDYPDLAGCKAHSLSNILKKTNIPVPRGFVVTTRAYRYYLKENNLHEFIDKQLRTLNLQWPERLEKTASVMRKAILDGNVPSEVEKNILSMLDTVRSENVSGSWAVRSSALAEDGEVSFAGQYDTLLDVPGENILNAYKTVLASKYSVRALTYRLHNGISDVETPMAVLFLPMIDARTSGVMYTLDPLDMCDGKCLVIAGVPGPGSQLVDGSAVADIYLISRHDPTHILDKQAATATSRSASGKVHPDQDKNMCLDDHSAITLARWGLELESLTEKPLDIEWSVDQKGDLFVLQSRPISSVSLADGDAIEKYGPSDSAPDTFFEKNHENSLLIKGTPASNGVAAGTLYRISQEKDLGKVPRNAILLTEGIPPSLVGVLERVGAVIAEKGSKAGHFASVAREFGLPVIVGAGDTKGVLKPGKTVTVDAYHGHVYEGVIEELVSWHDQQKAKPASPFQKKLEPLLDLVSPLNLTDPSSENFSPANCQTFHDLVRFVHEKGTLEMFFLVDTDGPPMRKAKQLKTDIPIVMHVLDLSDGLAEQAGKLKAINPEHIRSSPMQAVWSGLTHRDVHWSKGLIHMDWEKFDQVSGGIMSLKSSSLGSFALLAEHYAHLLLRFGYHFAVLDTMAGDRAEENYIQFRFKGGGGTSEKKQWRLALVDRVLTDFDFRVMIREDLLEAGCKRLDRQTTDFRLKLLGYLLGRTPLLDMALDSQEDALKMADDMIEKWRRKEKTS